MNTIEQLDAMRDFVNGWIADIHQTNIVETGTVVDLLLELNFMLTAARQGLDQPVPA